MKHRPSLDLPVGLASKKIVLWCSLPALIVAVMFLVSSNHSIRSRQANLAKVDSKHGRRDDGTPTGRIPSAEGGPDSWRNNQGSSRGSSPPVSTVDASFKEIARHTVIDILSIGSKVRPAYQDAQEATFGSDVRRFVRITEDFDSEPSCPTNLTLTAVVKIILFCKRKRHVKPIRQAKLQVGDKSLRHWNYMRTKFMSIPKMMRKANPVGWLCAQKRPLEGFYSYMQRYRTKDLQPFYTLASDGVFVQPELWSQEELPDYLLVVDDDTYVNVQLIEPELASRFPSTSAYAVAGCMIRPRGDDKSKANFTFPHGGFGLVLSKPVLVNFLHPIHCWNVARRDNDVDGFASKVCSQLADNLIGEQPLFQDGMSVLDLIQAYVSHYHYIDYKNWKAPGYCVHSDWVWGYFINAYKLAGNAVFLDSPEDRLRPYWNSSAVLDVEPRDECFHDNKNLPCSVDSHFCHYTPPEQMRDLHELQH